jgi:hypothetical protein
MPCNCLKCETCCNSIRELCKGYHLINIKTSYCAETYKHELILRLHYEIYCGYISQHDIKNNKWLISEKRDEGHNTWMLFIVNNILENKDYIEGLNIIEALNQYTKEKIITKNKINSSEENEWYLVVKELAFINAEQSFYESIDPYSADDGWKYYNPPIFTVNNIQINGHYANCYSKFYNLRYEEILQNVETFI